jgi:MFS family permease
MPSLRGLLAHRHFMRFMGARFLAVCASQMLMVAVAWHMYDLTGSAWDLGLVGLFQFVPALLLTLPAGHVADRVHRGRLFAACVAVQALVSAVLMWATLNLFASKALILSLSMVLGCVRAFQMPAQQALTPLLLPKALLQRGIALSSSGLQAATICGPALGGVLYAQGPLMVYGVCAVVLLLACALTISVRYVHHITRESVSWESAMAGVVFVWRHKILLGATSLDLFAVLLGGATALLPIYARDILQVGPEGLGLLRAAPAAGALLMSFVMLRWPLRRHVGYSLLATVAVFGLATVVFGLSRHFGLSLLALAITGAADNVSVVTRLTLMQLETPDEIRGRVAAVNSIFIGASNQLGEFESGSVAALFGPVVSVVSGGVGTMLVAATWFKLFPTLAHRNRMQ